MSPKAIAVAGLSALAIAASGCSGGSDSDSDAEATFRAAFQKRFETAPSALLWYDHITGMEMVDWWLEIATDLEPETNLPKFSLSYDSAAAREICGVAMNFALDSAAGDGIEGVSVLASDGGALGSCA